MKKIIPFISVLACLNGQSFAQDQPARSKSFIGLSGGYAHAGGNFVKSDYENTTAGYANSSGFNFGLEGAYYFHKHLGLGAVLSSTSFNTAGLQTLVNGYKDAFDVDSSAVTVSGQYRLCNFLIGPYFSFPFKRLTLDLRLVGGLVYARTPGYRVDLEDQAGATFYQDVASTAAFGLQAGAGLRYSLLKNLAVKVSVDYYYTRPDFKITNENRQNAAGRLLTSYKQPIACLQLNVGLAYQFGK